MPVVPKSQSPKLLEEGRQVLRLHHYSIHTERSYVDWIVRFAHFHKMRSREDLLTPEAKIEAFLTHLAVNKDVAPSTQNQAMNALVFLYKRVLNLSMDGSINAVRADTKVNVPVVMTREEVAAVISLLNGTPQLIMCFRPAICLWTLAPARRAAITLTPASSTRRLRSPCAGRA